MRRAILVILVIVLAVFTVGVAAYADGPGGSTEHHQDCRNNTTGAVTHDVSGPCPTGSTASTHYTNDVECGSNNDVGGLDVAAGPGGFEICSGDGSSLPVQGRVMAAGDPASQSGYAGADGDVDNSPAQAGGWLGVSSEAGTPVACGDDNGTRDLSHADSNDDIQDCAP